MERVKIIKHKKIEICGISKKPINTDKENYCVLLDCMGKEIKSVKFYKAENLNSLIKGNIDKVTAILWKRTQQVTNNLVSRFVKPKNVYDIK